MAIETHVKKFGNKVIVTIGGHLDYETTDEMKDRLNELCVASQDNQVIFDFANLQFVGSSGITQFISALREFNDRATTKPAYTNVQKEFRRFIVAFDTAGSFDFWDLDHRGITSIDN